MMRSWIGLLAILSLTGCASAPPQVVVAGLNQIAQERFELDGRIAMRYRDDSASATIHWQHKPENDSLTLSSPLGQTLTALTRDASGATLVDSEQKTHRAQNVAELTERLLGWQLPLDNLTYWVVGRAAPDITYQLQQDNEHGLTRLTQSGWVVTYSRWQQVDGVNLPSKLSLVGRGVELRLVIVDWKLAGME